MRKGKAYKGEDFSDGETLKNAFATSERDSRYGQTGRREPCRRDYVRS